MATPHSQTPPDGGGNINNTNSSPLTFPTPAQLLQTLIPFRNHIMFIRKLTLFSCLVAVKGKYERTMGAERLVIEDFISLYPLFSLTTTVIWAPVETPAVPSTTKSPDLLRMKSWP